MEAVSTNPKSNACPVGDDHGDMREYLSSILVHDFNVIRSNSGMDALHKVKETIPTWVI